MSDDLVEIGRYLTSAEAAIVRGKLDAEGIRSELTSEAVSDWLAPYMGTAVGGVRLLVAAADLPRAQELIGEISAIDESEDVGEMAEDEEQQHEQLPDDLLRAWRASLVGLFLCPPLLNFYSLWLLLCNDFFFGRCRNWRVAAAGILNMISIGVFFRLYWLMLTS